MASHTVVEALHELFARGPVVVAGEYLHQVLIPLRYNPMAEVNLPAVIQLSAPPEFTRLSDLVRVGPGNRYLVHGVILEIYPDVLSLIAGQREEHCLLADPNDKWQRFYFLNEECCDRQSQRRIEPLVRNLYERQSLTTAN